MKLHATRPSGVNTITGYGEGYVMVNGERRASSVVVLATRIEDWSVERFEALTAEDFEFLKALAQPDSTRLARPRSWGRTRWGPGSPLTIWLRYEILSPSPSGS